MNNKAERLIKKLIRNHHTIATMESCTGGAVVNCLTNIPGSSEVLRYSAVTYSNAYKVKMGVSHDIIDKYSVYSMETAKEMAYHIALYAEADFGIGVTGQLNCVDPNNRVGECATTYVSVYARNIDKYYNFSLNTSCKTRLANKNLVVNKTLEFLLNMIQ